MNDKKSFEKREFNIKFIVEYKKGENSYLIKAIKESNYLNIIKQISTKSHETIILKNNNEKFKINLIDINKNTENNINCIADCIILEYDLDDIKGFEEIKNLWCKEYKETNKTNLVYLIGIKADSSEEKTKEEASKFSNTNNLIFLSISNRDDNDIKIFSDNLLENLIKKETINNKSISNKITPSKERYKIMFVGDSGIGAKTSLLAAIMGREFNYNQRTTMDYSYSTKKIKTKNNKIIYLDLWDTPGYVRYRSSLKFFYKDVDCFVFGFDITKPTTFNSIKDWYMGTKDCSNVKLMYLIGNKTDLFDIREVSEEDARNLAKEYNFRYFETSCLLDTGIQEFVNDLENEIIKI